MATLSTNWNFEIMTNVILYERNTKEYWSI